MEGKTVITALHIAILKSLRNSRRTTENITAIVAPDTQGVLDHLKDLQSEGFVRFYDPFSDWKLEERGEYLVWLSQHPKFQETFDLVLNRMGKAELEFLAELLFGSATRKLQ